MEVTGIILAGGKSSRMGTDKGLIPFNGVPMIQHLINELEDLKIPIVIISNNTDYEQFGFPVIEDLVKEKGPVAGIYTALTNSSTEYNIVLSCDAPFVKKEVLNMLMEKAIGQDVVISSYNGKQHPLIAVYAKTATIAFKTSLDKDQLRLQEVNQLLKTCIVDFTDKMEASMFANINTQEELKELEL